MHAPHPNHRHLLLFQPSYVHFKKAGSPARLLFSCYNRPIVHMKPLCHFSFPLCCTRPCTEPLLLCLTWPDEACLLTYNNPPCRSSFLVTLLLCLLCCSLYLLLYPSQAAREHTLTHCDSPLYPAALFHLYRRTRSGTYMKTLLNCFSLGIFSRLPAAVNWMRHCYLAARGTQ